VPSRLKGVGPSRLAVPHAHTATEVVALAGTPTTPTRDIPATDTARRAATAPGDLMTTRTVQADQVQRATAPGALAAD
jgi:hypothetical protein